MGENNYNFAQVIKRASKTFYFSSLFFPKRVRRDVHILYAFLRISDDLVDSIPSKEDEFITLKKELLNSLIGIKSKDIIVESFSDLARRKGIDHQIIFDYLDVQEKDLKKKSYATYQELDRFIYGVAGVVGLMMAKVMDLKEASFSGAIKLAEAMQNVNIIRDIAEDLSAGKVYLPQDELKRFGLPNKLDKEDVEKNFEEYCRFIRFQLDRTKSLLTESRESFRFIPNNILKPIKIVADIYEEVINRIYADPALVFKKKMKPSIWTIVRLSFKNYFL